MKLVFQKFLVLLFLFSLSLGPFLLHVEYTHAVQQAVDSENPSGTAPAKGLTSGEAAAYLATDPSKCESIQETVDGKNKVWINPRNCLFLEEPIGGKKGWDLYYVNCSEVPTVQGKSTVAEGCIYKLWKGQKLNIGERGPIQAVLTEDPSKPYQGPFGLLYSYVGLVYKYLSGLIVSVVILFIVIGGIQISTDAGTGEGINAGKARITKAIVGLIVWFTASLILYTINPTFFNF